MNILMITSELHPFAKVGGLADAVGSLSVALSKAGHDVRVVMPRYYRIDRKSLRSLPGAMTVHLGCTELHTEVYESTIPGSKVTVYFIDYEKLFGRDGIYGTNIEPDFADNPVRFSLLCNAAFQICRKQQWIPDIMHSHDWQGALACALLKFNEANSEFKNTAGVLTIHNIGYQGIYGKQNFPATSLDWIRFYASGFEDWDRINFLKAGITCADKITTVSPTYAAEIKTPQYGFRLDGVLRFRSEDLVGILNGIDTKVWNPKTDKLIEQKYSAETLDKKLANKLALQKKLGLEVNPNIPLFGMVTRLVDQKGVSDLFGPAYGCAYRLCSQIKMQMVVLGSGEKWCESELISLTDRLPNLKVYIGYNEQLSHLIEAGSDFYLMPSKYEPCGLNQMYSLNYGTIPIVRRTGGLADTVQNYNEQTGAGTGFMFDYLSPESIADTVGWATYAYYNKRAHIIEMQKRGMGLDFSWAVSAKKYLACYKEALEKKRGTAISATSAKPKTKRKSGTKKTAKK